MTQAVWPKELDETQRHMMSATFSMVRALLPEGMACNRIMGCSKEDGPPDTAAVFVFGEDAVEDLEYVWKILANRRQARKNSELLNANAAASLAILEDNERLSRELAELQKIVAELIVSKGEATKP